MRLSQSPVSNVVLNSVTDTPHKRIDEIEVLRAIAILFTLFHHTAFYLLPPGNILIEKVYGTFTFWGGVDLFFVISGFVIMKSLGHSLRTHAASKGQARVFTAFWVRRTSAQNK